MITRQDSTKYSTLFAEATELLNLPKPISSLNEYFAALYLLADRDLKYTILPLNEEPFVINANTREIEPSASFPRNIVGVQGDQVAEIIYFKIDRYFDAMDLNTQNIYIEWENAAGEKGLSSEYVRDITSEPNYIIFGWPLAKQITDYAGVIKYAIRFYGFKDDAAVNKEIVYSFATQPASIIIQPSMNYEITDNERYQILSEDIVSMIKDRFQQYRTEEDNVEETVPEPIMLSNEFTVAAGTYDVSDKDCKEDKDKTSYTLRAQALVTGELTYEPQIKNSKGIFVKWDTPMQDEYIQTLDVERVEGKIYYMDGDENGVPAKIKFYEAFNASTGNRGIQEKYRCAYVTKPGEYRIQATNRIGISTKSNWTPVAIFPAPESPVIDGGGAEAAIPVKLNDNTATLKVEYSNSKPAGVQKYAWAKKIVGTESEWGIIEGAEDQSYNLTTAEEEGIYRAAVINSRNGADTAPVYVTYRVTQPPQTPVFLSPDDNLSLGKINNPLTVQVKVDGVPFDTIQIKWYNAPTETDDGNECLTNEPIYVNSQGEASYIPTEPGIYYAEATLTRNTFTAIARSNRWSVLP